MRIFFYGVSEKELGLLILPAFLYPAPSLIPWYPGGSKLSEVLLKSFLMGPLMIGLEGARVSGREHGSPPRSAVLCLAQTPPS